MSKMHSYSSIYNLGHRAVVDLFSGPVIVEEKIDGSQFSFQLGTDGVLRARSKGAELNLEAPEKMFAAGVETIKKLEPDLIPGLTYRGEYLAKPKHNALAYDRVPAQNVILFDIDKGDQDYLSVEAKAIEADRLGLEVVPAIENGVKIENVETFRAMLDRTSILGGQKIEGVVIKPLAYSIYGIDKKVLMGKFVSEAFRETHQKAWSEANPGGKDVIQILGASYGTQARWQKAVQHLRDAGQIEDDPRDIGKLFKEVPADVLKECKEEITEALFKWAWPQISRLITRGLPDWYKDALLRSQFEQPPAP